MDKAVTIEMCMGSSCFARGNNMTAAHIQEMINDRGWEQQVGIKGTLCQNLCKEGPVVIVNGVLYKRIDMASLLDAVEEILTRSAA